MEVRGVRDRRPRNKVYLAHRTHNQSEVQAGFVGMRQPAKLSVEASLKKLRTDYIDLVRTVCSLDRNPLRIFVLTLLLLHNIAHRPLVGFFQRFHRGSHDLINS